MKKALAVAALLAGLVALGRLARGRMADFDWETAFARMPDNAPPKWMFRNISAIRENTERILDLLQRERGGVRAEDAEPAPPE